MQAVIIEDFGGAEQLQLKHVPDPRPAAGQVLIAVEAGGIGYMDVLLRRGTYRGAYHAPAEAGFVPGGEVAGTVVALGEGVDESWLRQRVFAMTGQGGYAELVLADAQDLIRLPAEITAAAAVALGINALVAHFAVERAHIAPQEQVLIRGAAGGIGVLAAQLAVHAGAQVSATTSSPERGQRLRQLGVAQVLGRELNAAGPAYDVIIDPVGGADIGTWLQQLKANGRMVLCGAVAGFPAPDFGLALLSGFQRSLSLATLSLDSVAQGARARALQNLFELAQAGHLTAVYETLPLTAASNAHVRLEAGDVFGKLVLVPGQV